jgi:alkyl sulfatase BDS1-like metallo-beta-lactamase superfamily hydrolase
MANTINLSCWRCFLSIAVIILFLNACRTDQPGTSVAAIYEKSPEELKLHSAEFRKEVLRIGERTWVAIGFGLANSIMIEGDDGLIVIDAMESMQEGEEVRKAFRTISDKPVSAIIYTHNHADHVFGAKAIAGEDDPVVIAHELMPYYLDRIATVIRPIVEKRGYRMFGNLLEEGEVINCGIGPRLGIDADTELGVIRPDITFRDSLQITISGVELHLYHAPGETPDQLFVWMPAERMLFSGDNFYKTFPNLYTIRGTAHRDVNTWKESIDKIRYMEPDYLVPSHTRPLEGREYIDQVLTDYRDAIQYVHDQTVRHMNKGMTPDEIVDQVKLPEHLKASPYLAEFYGKVEWTVRSIFNGYLGWFSGDPAGLHPYNGEEKAERMAALCGGASQLEEAMVNAFEDGDYQWALELAGHVGHLDERNRTAAAVKVNSLLELGIRESNPNARHYYLTAARELQGLKNEGLVTPGQDMVHSIPMSSIFDGMATFLDADKARDVERSMVFEFTDTGERYSVIVRKGVAEVKKGAVEDADHRLTTTSGIWKEIAAETRKPLPAFLSGKVKVDGGKIAFLNFMDLFDR